MNKREAYLEMLQGRKVRLVSWPTASFVHMADCGAIVTQSNLGFAMNRADTDGWEMYEKPKRIIRMAPAIYKCSVGHYNRSTVLFESEGEAIAEFSKFKFWQFIQLDWAQAVEVEEWAAKPLNLKPMIDENLEVYKNE